MLGDAIIQGIAKKITNKRQDGGSWFMALNNHGRSA
jgi:hypothetical protein